MRDNYTYLMAAVGTALHAWSQVETGMAQLFWSVSGISGLGKSDAIFDAVISFETRLAILDAAIEHEEEMSEEEKRIWSRLSARLRKLYKKRHEVAHFSLASPEDIVNGARIAPFFTWGKHRRQTTKYLTERQIIQRAAIFAASTSAVNWFTNLMQRRKLPQGSQIQPVPEPDMIVRIRELLAQTPEGHALQLEPDLD